MSKRAEQAALKAYPKIATVPKMVNVEDGTIYDANASKRKYFMQGYEQAEKDLALTWEDAMHFRVVYDILDTLQENEELNVCPMSKEYYEEALRRFNELKRNRNENH